VSSVELPQDIRAVLLEYRRRLLEAFGTRLELVRLFGSRARGDADADSDADVAVVVRDLTESERTLVIDQALEAWRAAGSPRALLSPLVWSSGEYADRLAHERRIALDILREGIAL
jgi:predicted nucleotidyltransferase